MGGSSSAGASSSSANIAASAASASAALAASSSATLSSRAWARAARAAAPDAIVSLCSDELPSLTTSIVINTVASRTLPINDDGAVPSRALQPRGLNTAM